MLSVITKLFNSNEKDVGKFRSIVLEISALEPEVKKLKDTQFAKKTEELRKRVTEGESLDSILPEAFALAREAARRTIGQRHYDVQLIASITLAKGKIAEQRTGEGKTLSAVPALYLHSLTGKNVHLVTVNDYLARRDCGWMGPIFHLLGVSVSSIINDASYMYDPEFTNKEVGDYRLLHLKEISRKEAYGANIVYGINSEFGFDYLRDNMAGSLTEMKQRGHYFAIVDEVDSVLIDEARTPHIISAPEEEPTKRYYEYATLVQKLSSDVDYKVDEKLKTAHLTDHGIAKLEKLYGIENIYEKDFDIVYHLEAALKARTLFHKEKDYIVKDGAVILVDEFTGRLLEGRRLSEGLHQAIEAKENVAIQRESKTLATVSLQNYFRMYERLAGMTGTAVTEAEEFHKIYKLDVVVIPTNNPMVRKDMSDVVYKTSRAKMTAVVEEVEQAHKRGQPVLVGTTSIEKNEIVSQLLKRRGIPHQVLNAKNHLKEAEIISMAGAKGAITVATNMAGRGVDIVLGGESPKREDGTEKRETTEWKKWEKEHNQVLESGGLYVIGTERHESRRIDNQLRGRSGRQGDPGMSKFFVSLDDEIMRLFGGDSIAGLMTRFNMPENVPLEHGLVSRAIAQAQVKVEGFNFDIRKHLVEYDDVLNKQREIIYSMRRGVLESAEDTGQSLKESVVEKIRAAISILITMHQSIEGTAESSPDEKIVQELTTIIPFDDSSQQQLVKQLMQFHSAEEKIEFLSKLAADVYKKREDQVGEKVMREVERYVSINVVDNLWIDHLDAINNLRQGIGLRGYGQRDPLVEYKNEAFTMFERLIATIDDEIVHRVYKIHVHQEQKTTATHTHTHENDAEGTPSGPAGSLARNNAKPFDKLRASAEQHGIQRSSASSSAQISDSSKKKLGRNDPCWCGSGKKWKKCHYPQTTS